MHGNDTYFIHNRHINHTNVCVNTCQFCAFGVKEGDPTAYTKTLDEIFSDAELYKGGQVSEFHIVGGLHPDLSFQYYLDMISGLKSRFPNVHIQAFTAVELQYLAQLAKKSLEETLVELHNAGLGSIPGGGAGHAKRQKSLRPDLVPYSSSGGMCRGNRRRIPVRIQLTMSCMQLNLCTQTPLNK
jgi:aminodeoxyfutalosine synthase